MLIMKIYLRKGSYDSLGCAKSNMLIGVAGDCCAEYPTLSLYKFRCRDLDNQICECVEPELEFSEKL